MSALFVIFLVLLGGTAAGVIMSYAIAWYEYANRDPRLMENRFSISRLLFAGRLIGIETCLLFLTLLVRPLGWLRYKKKKSHHLRPPPIILLHGLFHNRSCWLWMMFRLRRRGFSSITALNLSLWRNPESATERLAKKVDELRIRLGVEKVILVGHSMGGIIARNYFQVRGGGQKVERCILLGAPNSGSRLAPFAISPMGKLLLPGSAFLQRLSEAPLPENVQVVSIYSRHDNLVVPFESAHMEGASNIVLTGVGHTALLYDSKVFKALAENLNGGRE